MNQYEVSCSLPAHERLHSALESLRRGGGVLVTDDEDRENEADVIFSTQFLTQQQMALLIRECSGIVCLCLPSEKVKALGLSAMVQNNTSRHHTAFTTSIEAAEGVTTGVSAADRLRTVKAATADNARPRDLRQPGHVFPLQARAGGVLERPGHTEATIDLMRLAGLQPYGVLCELMNPDGTMARGEQVRAFSRLHGMPIVAVADVIAYRKALSLVEAGS
ncbi:MAG TPA: 3,4-dihydroxy-2-butanone-4-phosphate synthase [Clostridia bacterium]|nr:3,4-dihydroxy-2-butanone-4-phosphate synthase [Clostridia bacterium]